MVFSDGFDDFAECQVEEWESDKFDYKGEVHLKHTMQEKSRKNLFENNEINLISLKKTSMKNFDVVQGAPDGDVMHFQKDVEDMMEAVKTLQKTLSEEGRVDEIFRIETTGEGGGKTENPDLSIQVCFQQMEKMDAILRVKAAEEKRARLCRIQAEEESRDILSKLPRVELSNGVEVNMMEFIKLLNDTEETEFDSSCPQNLEQGGNAVDEGKNQDNNQEKTKAEKKSGENRKCRNSKFIEKNIQLAKCGHGTLSLTDEEKNRIEELLEETEVGNSEASSTIKKDLYALDDETKFLLSEIDRQLKTVAQLTKRVRVTQNLSAELVNEEPVCEKVEKSGTKERDPKKHKRSRRLAEIDQLLNFVNSVCQEEIAPLSEEVIESLLEESRREERLFEERDLGKEEKGEGGAERGKTEGESAKRGDVKGSEDFICELVSKAKLLMPRFKYRFDDSK